jgi:hypothetical protein
MLYLFELMANGTIGRGNQGPNQGTQPSFRDGRETAAVLPRFL